MIRDGKFCGFELVTNKRGKDMNEGIDGREMSCMLKLKLKFVFEVIKHSFDQASFAQE